MIVKDQREALCVACEMERRAIRTYERALMVVKDERVAQAIAAILQDEREHLRHFSSMKEASCAGYAAEERLLLSAMAADTLFPGGVMEMQRKDGLSSVKALYTFAAGSEEDAMNNYDTFADKCDDPEVRLAFRAIAREEAGHLCTLRETLKSLEKE